MLPFRSQRKRLTVIVEVYVMIPLGRIPDNSGGQAMIKELIWAVRDSGFKHIILDLRRAYFVGDSAGVFFSHALSLLAKLKGTIRLCCVSVRNENHLRALKFWDCVETFPTRKAALESFKD